MASVVHSIELPSGVALQYVEQGDPGRRSGAALARRDGLLALFEPVLAHLPSSIRAFALTQRGHGDASRPLEGYRYGDYAADVVAFMTSSGLGAALIVGHSMAERSRNASRSISPGALWGWC